MTHTAGDRNEVVSRLASQFDHHDPDLSADVLRDVYDRLLEKEGFHYSAAHGGMHLATHYTDIQEVEKRCLAFSSAQGVTHPRPADYPQVIPIDFDPPLHTAYRELFTTPVSPQSIRRFEPQLRDLTVELLDAFTKEPGGNFVSLVARPLSLLAMGTLLGWDPATNDEVLEYATQVLELSHSPKVLEPFKKLGELALSAINARRACPRDDYLTKLAFAEVNGTPLNDAELANLISTFLIAGFETTMNAISQIVLHLAQHPELQDELRAHPELIDGAVDEGLRMFPPVATMFRTVAEQTTVGGASFEVGDKVCLVLAAANQDPEKFANPHSFDVRRKNARGHLTFGFGPHFCAGAHLARAELRVLLEELTRYPNVELAGDPEYLPHLMMGQAMGLTQLPLFLSPQTRLDER